jgi:hypothetical protein
VLTEDLLYLVTAAVTSSDILRRSEGESHSLSARATVISLLIHTTLAIFETFPLRALRATWERIKFFGLETSL